MGRKSRALAILIEMFFTAIKTPGSGERWRM